MTKKISIFYYMIAQLLMLEMQEYITLILSLKFYAALIRWRAICIQVYPYKFQIK